MLIRKLERERFLKFRREFIAAVDDKLEGVHADDEDTLSAFLSERSGPHRGRRTNPDALVHNLILNGFVQPIDGIDTSPSFADQAMIDSGELLEAETPTPQASFVVNTADGEVREVQVDDPFAESVEAGLADIEAGRTISTEQLRERLEEGRAERAEIREAALDKLSEKLEAAQARALDLGSPDFDEPASDDPLGGF